MLKRFEKDDRLFYYDVKNDIVGINGHAKSINTQFGYYSKGTEEYLRDNIETPFSNLLYQIDQIDFNSTPFSLPSEIDILVKRFIYALISRSPQLLPEINNSSFFWQFLPEQIQHDYAVKEGIALAEKYGIFGDYFVTFAVNKSSMPFILPMCGLYHFRYSGIDTLFLPISPRVCIALVNNDGAEYFIGNGMGLMLLFTDDNQVRWFNKRAFAAQKNTGYGYVVSPEKAPLEECIGCE